MTTGAWEITHTVETGREPRLRLELLDERRELG